MTAKTIVGRLAPNAWRTGDPLPEIGSICLVSGANCDVESDQHRSYMWRKVVGYGDGDMFVCLQTEGCWKAIARKCCAGMPARRYLPRMDFAS